MIEKRIYKSGTIRYFKEGTNIRHREDGPAIEYADGYKAWYISIAEMRKKSREELLEWLLCYGDNFTDITRGTIKTFIKNKALYLNQTEL